MNRVSLMLVVAALAVQPAFASDDVESELAEMRALVEGLKEKVEAQEEQLSHQGDLLEQAQQRIQSDDGTESGLSSFVDSLEVTGHIASSYAYNLDDPDAPPAANDLGGDGSFYPFHRDHNEFVVDQIWFGLGKAATKESRAGFQFDILYGNTANFIGAGTTASRRTGVFDSVSDFYVQQAYIEYQMPCEVCGDVNFKLGKFQTYVGSEVVQSGANYNITIGSVYQLLQPVDHVGLTATSNLGPVEMTLGLLTSGGFAAWSPDNNEEKAYMASAALGDDRLNGRVTFIYGNETAGNTNTSGDRVGLVDAVLNFAPAENLGLWVNSTYLFAEGSSQRAWGIAAAGRLGITDDLGIALRGEFVQDIPAGGPGGANAGDLLFAAPSEDSATDGAKVYSVTATLDYALATNLMLRGEARYDKVTEEGLEYFDLFEPAGSNKDNQTVFLGELVYSF